MSDQRALARQVATEPAADQLAVLEEEEHQDRHQHQIDHRVDQQRQAGQREGQQDLPELGQLAAQHLDGLQHLLVGDQVRIALGQQQQQRLPFAEHPRQLVEQGDDLLPQQRHQHHQEQRQGADEQCIHQPHRQHARHAPVLELAHETLHQEGQHQAGQHRRQHAAEGEDGGEAEHQQHGQHHRLLVGEVALHPIAEHLVHQRTP
ncbi:hypothetical protein D9M70_385980 [compost metagenome]